jgi:hypothetical protein
MRTPAAALALTLAHIMPAAAFQAGCSLEPPWLCYLNASWWQGFPSEAEARAHLLKICHDTRSAVVCNDNGRIVRVPKPDHAND